MKHEHLLIRLTGPIRAVRGTAAHLAVVTLAFTMMAALAACGGKSAEPEPAPPAPTAAPQAAPETLPEPVTDPVTEAPAAVVDDGPVVDEDPDAFAQEMLEQMERDAAQAAQGVAPTLPDDFPQDIPLPDDYTLAAVSEGEASTTVQASSLRSLAELNAHFVQSMHAQGWTIAEESQDGGQFEQLNTIVFEKEGRVVSVNLIATNRLPHQQIVVTLHHE